ncbi:hypothetical protein CXIVA_12510 [Clostridium sp. SY8519]|uniref:TetR/AcrR family transcriptional regulator n=1 Tax=Clostridium sp. (strain SY8519) TaxID=1042156 RepID=UPI0002171E96|nr:TetR/AcrR family transcriptional regulator [Clostridium sp. SY8519]BAK47217.1 hypothetical protein CXIVA_12510 [Clostridium sp. SY8519]
MARNTRDAIVEALIDLSLEHPYKSSFTMKEIADRAGITRQSIYRKHFKNQGEIISYLRELVNRDVLKIYQEYDPNSRINPYLYVADHALPVFYQKRKMLRCLFSTSIDPLWHDFVMKTYFRWGAESLSPKREMIAVASGQDMISLLIGVTLSIIEVWICKENPLPPDKFKEIFLKLVQTPFYDMLQV